MKNDLQVATQSNANKIDLASNELHLAIQTNANIDLITKITILNEFKILSKKIDIISLFLSAALYIPFSNVQKLLKWSGNIVNQVVKLAIERWHI